MDDALSLKQKNTKIVKILVVVVIGMFGFGYALVPLYDVLCDLTGLNGKAKSLAAEEVPYKVDMTREINLELITSLNESTPMEFRAETKQLKVHPGEYYTVYFYGENMTDKLLNAQAIPSFTPSIAAKYFHKVVCFCLDQQIFKPKESKRMAMRFAVKPDFPKDLKTITLSYTFFDNTKAAVQN
ncbi:MAG: cytochrome c oxidase assembly protein [Methyloglobulus sp.]|nr:cytochrome c oxidase assembly protein [Methyloglobulus sp.]